MLEIDDTAPSRFCVLWWYLKICLVTEDTGNCVDVWNILLVYFLIFIVTHDWIVWLRKFKVYSTTTNVKKVEFPYLHLGAPCMCQPAPNWKFHNLRMKNQCFSLFWSFSLNESHMLQLFFGLIICFNWRIIDEMGCRRDYRHAKWFSWKPPGKHWFSNWTTAN